MKYIVALGLTLMVAGCASSDANIYRGGLFGQRVVGNEVSVSVTNVWNQADALPLADQHCAKYGKAARFSASSGYTMSFDCVSKSS